MVGRGSRNGAIGLIDSTPHIKTKQLMRIYLNCNSIYKIHLLPLSSLRIAYSAT
ncbi:hypothetical protein SynSYN20_02498 [Synechococcus sp. SYN20]|nr:hypothetical protein SynSYN20_02498 [Synechococcus sp. SYN20]